MVASGNTPKIFISYRRDDGGHGRALHEKLLDWFDAEQVFLDHENLDPGAQFRPELELAIKNCRVFLAIIGPHWLSEHNRQRLQNPQDVTRGEIRSALEYGKPLIPVLAGGASFPQISALPADIAALAENNAHHQLDTQYRASFQKLLDLLENRHQLKPEFRRQDGSRQSFYVARYLPSPHFADPAEKLPALHKLLEVEGRTALTAATVQGMGGVGKTQLALKYSHAFRDEYAGVWWFRAEDLSLLEQDCLELCRERQIERQDKESPSHSLARWLKKQPRWLLVYDNADEPKSVRPFLPEAGGHHVLFTSRNPHWRGLVREVLDIEAWSEQQALAFLHGRLPQRLNDAQARKLASALGGLPLALEMAAAYLDATGLPLDDYLAALADETEAPEVLAGSPDTGYPHGVFAALSQAFEKLSPAAQQLLRLCAYAAPEPLPEIFFKEAKEALPAALAEAAAKPLAWNKVAGELQRYGLAQRLQIPALDRAPGDITDRTEAALNLHRLTQQTVRARLAEPETDCRQFQAVLRACCPADAQLPAHWPRYASLAPHVTQLERYYAGGWLDSRRFSWLLYQVASYLQFGPALYTESQHWFRRALEINRQELGEEHPDTLAGMNNLALTLSAQGDLPGARVLQEKVLEIRRRMQGEEHLHTLACMNNLASTLSDQGNLSGARALQEKVLEIFRRVLALEHPDTLTSMGNLASTLMHQGDLPGARVLQEKVLEIHRRMLGEEHPNTLNSMNNLATALWNQGDLSGARALHENVLKIRRRVLGEEHPDTFTSMNNLAHILWHLGDHRAALALMGATFAGLNKVLGPEHPYTLGSRESLTQMQAALAESAPDATPPASPPAG